MGPYKVYAHEIKLELDALVVDEEETVEPGEIQRSVDDNQTSSTLMRHLVQDSNQGKYP